MENGQYLTYNEFLELGGTLDIVPFNLLELEARTNVDRETMGRIKNKSEQCNEVKLCMFKLIQGMSLDGNYKDANIDEKQKYIASIIYNCLAGVVVDGVAILYRGI